MTESDIKTLMYGSIRELTQNRNYFYNGYKGHYTEEGKRLINEMLDLYGEKILEAIKVADEQRSKDLVMKTLKGE